MWCNLIVGSAAQFLLLRFWGPICAEGGGGGEGRWGKGERIDDSYDRPGRVDPKKKSPDFRSSLDFVIMHKTYICKMCSVQIVFIFRI